MTSYKDGTRLGWLYAIVSCVGFSCARCSTPTIAFSECLYVCVVQRFTSRILVLSQHEAVRRNDPYASGSTGPQAAEVGQRHELRDLGHDLSLAIGRFVVGAAVLEHLLVPALLQAFSYAEEEVDDQCEDDLAHPDPVPSVASDRSSLRCGGRARRLLGLLTEVFVQLSMSANASKVSKSFLAITHQRQRPTHVVFGVDDVHHAVDQ